MFLTFAHYQGSTLAVGTQLLSRSVASGDDSSPSEKNSDKSSDSELEDLMKAPQSPKGAPADRIFLSTEDYMALEDDEVSPDMPYVHDYSLPAKRKHNASTKPRRTSRRRTDSE